MNPSHAAAFSPSVSVITATYNWSSVLAYALRSVLRQTFADFEMLIIGDGCTDNSEEVVASFGDPRVRWQNLATNSGHQWAPNNAGLALARGRYIAYLGHDDLWLPSHLQTLVAAMEDTRCDLAFSCAEIIGPPGSNFRTLGGAITADAFDLSETAVPPSIWMHRHQLAAEIGPWRNHHEISIPPDQEFLERAFERGKKLSPVPRLTALRFPASMRQNCYVQRDCAEQAAYTQRIETEPDFAERELIMLADSFLQRHPADRIPPSRRQNQRAGAIIEHSRAKRGLGSNSAEPSLPEEFPVLHGRIDFRSSEADPFLVDGWSVPEPAFRWTEKKEAVAFFALDAIEPSVLRIKFVPFLAGGRLTKQMVTFSLNCAVLTTISVTDERPAVHQMKLPAGIMRQQNVLKIALPSAASPIAFGINADNRLLGIAVEWVEIVPTTLRWTILNSIRRNRPGRLVR